MGTICGHDATGGQDLNAERELFEVLSSLTTEASNPRTGEIDLASTTEILQLIHAEDRIVAACVDAVIDSLAVIVDHAAEAFRRGGRLIYAGAGTSGRLGVLDAAECPPTFGTDPVQVVGLIAGGHPTLVRSAEGIEDDRQNGAVDVDRADLDERDVLVGISASHRTPYVRGALDRARARGAWTAFLVCNRIEDSGASPADHVVEVVVGPEAITGSTRMKAALAQKMMLTMISTASMVRIGKVYGNLMVDVAPTSQKLKERAKGLVMNLAEVEYEAAAELLDRCGYDVKCAIVMSKFDLDPFQARLRLQQSDGFLRRTLDPAGKQ